MADVATAGLILLGLAEVPQVMSAFLPSPTTAFQGGADPERVSWLRRGEVIGSAVSLSIALAVTLVARKQVGENAWYIFLGAVVILGAFLLEYERAIRKGQENDRSAENTTNY